MDAHEDVRRRRLAAECRDRSAKLRKRRTEVEQRKRRDGFFVRRAKRGIYNRERSRMNRTRLFGTIRQIIRAVGETLYRTGRIDDPEDVFYIPVPALERSGETMVQLAVKDRGILHDADTPDDYKALLAYHNEQLARPIISVSLAREKVFFDTRTAMLLRLVEETDSVRTACQRMQMSYSTGWNVIRALESQLSRTLIERSQGGAGGGKSRLTEDGKLFLNRYEAYAAALRDDAAGLFDRYFEGMF